MSEDAQQIVPNEDTVGKETARVVAAVLRTPAVDRMKVLREELTKCAPAVRLAVEPLVLLAMESGRAYHPRQEFHGFARTTAALICGALAGFFTGFFSLEGTVWGLTIRGGGALAVFVFVFLFYPPHVFKRGHN
jgi:hypothetical protein